MEANKIVAWSNLRFDYYANGRGVALNQSPRIGGILLGYAIESSLKMMIDFSSCLKLANSHNLIALYKEYKTQGFTELSMSDDFLIFANDRLDQRYPNASDRVMKWHTEEDRFQDFPIDNIIYYDDVICQLDDVITKRFQCASSSVLVRSALNLETYPGRSVFHCNHHAKKRFDYIQSTLQSDPSRTAEATQFIAKKDTLWNFCYMLMWIPESYTIHHAKDYMYPRWENNCDGTKKATLRFRNWLPNRPADQPDVSL